MKGVILHNIKSKDVFKGILTCLFALACCVSMQAQRLVMADVVSQQLANGKKSKQEKHLFCQQDGRMVVSIKTTEGESVLLTDQYGRTEVYNPKTNTVMFDKKGHLYASVDEPLQVFLQRRTQDMGMESYGFKLNEVLQEEGKYLKKIFKSTEAASHCAKVEIVYENYLPVFMAFYDRKDKVINKIYYAHYDFSQRFVFPQRITEISYMGTKDSMIRLDVYSNIRVDVYDEMFDYKVPADAERKEMP